MITILNRKYQPLNAKTISRILSNCSPNDMHEFLWLLMVLLLLLFLSVGKWKEHWNWASQVYSQAAVILMVLTSNFSFLASVQLSKQCSPPHLSELLLKAFLFLFITQCFTIEQMKTKGAFWKRRFWEPVATVQKGILKWMSFIKINVLSCWHLPK